MIWIETRDLPLHYNNPAHLSFPMVKNIHLAFIFSRLVHPIVTGKLSSIMAYYTVTYALKRAVTTDLFRVTRTSLIALINEVSSGTTPLMHGIHLVGFLTLCSICSLVWPLLWVFLFLPSKSLMVDLAFLLHIPWAVTFFRLLWFPGIPC